MEKRLTDNEIIKALECCKKDDCDNCPNDFGNCYANLAGYALDLINRLQAENEVYETCNARKDEAIKSLESRLKKLQMQFDDISKLYSEIKAEAYKECIEKVKEEIKQALESNYNARAERENKDVNLYLDDSFWNYCSGKISCLRGLDDFCDNILKELVGEDNGN